MSLFALQQGHTEVAMLLMELHDSSGHHLAALNGNIRLMRHMPQAREMAEKIDECLLVVKQLLSDVRGVVRDFAPGSGD